MTSQSAKRETPRHRPFRALVTGGAGFIGSNLAIRLLAEGHEVIVVDNLSRGQRRNVPAGAEFVRLDIGDRRLHRLLAQERPEIIFHLAAHINLRESVADPAADAQVNVVGSLNLLRAAAESGVRRLVFSSSGGAMYNAPPRFPALEKHAECPLSPYGVAKRAFELYLESARQTTGLDYVALRYANVYGPRQDTAGEAGVVAIFIEKILAGQPLKVFGDGGQTRDFVFVGDVVDANLRAATAAAASGLGINIGTGVETSVNEVAELVAAAFGRPAKIKRFPPVPGELRRSALDWRLAKKTLGWKPTVKIDEGIRLTADWFREKR